MPDVDATRPADSDRGRTFYLIDGHAQIYRAYFAIRTGLTSSTTGEPIHAVYSFAATLLRFFQRCQPRYAAMALDSAGPTFRHELFTEYKATREAPPDDFHTQESRILELTRAYGVPMLREPGAEADDIIATLVHRVLDDPGLDDVHIRIVSRDKDLEQLLGPRVTLYDIHNDETVDVDRLLQDKGVSPEQVVDVLALAGDKVDNVPGVDGIGVKTAAKLINQFGDLDALLTRVGEIKGKRGAAIAQAADRLPLSRQLVTLKDDVPVDWSLQGSELGPVDAAGVRRFLEDLGLRRQVREFDDWIAQAAGDGAADSGHDGGDLFSGIATTDAAAPKAGIAANTGPTLADEATYHIVRTAEQLATLVERMRAAPIIALDTETTGLDRKAPCCGLSVSVEPGEAWYVPTRSPTPEKHLREAQVVDALRPVLEDPARGKTGHNLKFDGHVLARAGVRMRGVVFDTMLAAALLDLPARGLDDLSLERLGKRLIPIRELLDRRGGDASAKPKPGAKASAPMDQVPVEEIGPYAAEDADAALRLYHNLAPEIRSRGMDELMRLEAALIPVLVDMEAAGIRLDPEVLRQQQEQLAGRIAQLRLDIQSAAENPFNPDSPKQLAEVLFTQLQLPVIKRTKTGPSTDVEVLERLADHPELAPEQTRVPRLVLEYRQLTKLVNTYLAKLHESVDPEDGRIHATFHQTGAATGRLSSTGPNMQNIPIRTDLGRQIRRAFVAEPGRRLIAADYSQIELRVLAHLSEDAGLLAAFRADQDIHAAVASQVFGVPIDQVDGAMRTQAKTINFGIVYGVTPWGLARRIDELDVDSARELIETYKKQFPGIEAFLARCVAEAEAHGYVTTMLGRRRRIREFEQGRRQRALAERLAINSVVQGSAADLIKLAMVQLHQRIDAEALPLRILLQIHDELVMEAPEADTEAMTSIAEQVMSSAIELKVPLRVDTGTGGNWFDCK